MPVRRWMAWRDPLLAMTALFGCEAAFADEVPLRMVRNHLFFEVAINGHPTVALLDTGAASSWIDQELAAELGIGALWLLAEEGSGPHVRNDRTVPAGVRIGKDVSEERTLGLIDVDPIFGDLPDEAPMPRAIVGLDVLRHYVIELDLDRSVADFTPADAYSDFPAQGAVALERAAGGLAILRVTLDGLEARSVVDTGATSAVHMSLDFAGAVAVASRAPSQTMVSTVAGVSPRPVGALAQVELNGRTFRNAPVTLSVQPLGRGIDAVVGMQLLGQFNLVLDLSRSRMWMTPNRSFGSPFRRDRIGLHTLGGRGEESAPLVLVAPGSPAEKAGFRTGEIVREMRDEAGAKIESGRDVAPGQTVTIVMGDGSSRTLVGAEYY
jgi:predicted aspartyl protease